ncbi:hypothetical protein [Oryzomicrobium sp.]|uniref:hypothetical protein n=1 Tax=Oryzomicrobium sp. TaxID=1911578 RepID=UPI0025DC7E12|nr:hypothetical protein [Oryzomicrobium sp.]MCE1244124.1 hypothetical protein [Oryzomicrobium sp.]
MSFANRPAAKFRPRLTVAMVAFALVDVAGLLLFAVGFAYLVRGPGVFFPDFPAGVGSAISLTAVGLALVFWAATRMVRQVVRQSTSDQTTADTSTPDRP